MNPLVLIVEDEPAQVEVLRYNLEAEGFRTSVATDGDEALLKVNEENPDLIVLDWMLPEVSGIEVCRRLREKSKTKSTPIIMLTARGEETDRVRGLNAGADDYVVKPYSPSEMVARVRAVMRRMCPALAGGKIDFGDVVMDLDAHKVIRDGTPIHLGPTEYRLLKTLIGQPKRVFSREQLLDRIWGRDVYVEERTVDVHIRRLRRALNDGGRVDLIRTVRGAGYSLDGGEA